MNPLVVDIETVPLQSSMELPYPAADRQPPANYKSDEAIAKWREADEQKWKSEAVKAYSVNPRLGRVLCIGIATSGQKAAVVVAPEEREEVYILNKFWQLVNEHHGNVVTWNGAWDLRFIIIRSIANGIMPTAYIADWFRKYSVTTHFDCKAVLLNWDVRAVGEGLDEWAKFFGLGGKSDGMDGSMVYEKHLAGAWSEIADYCANDVHQTDAIFRRIVGAFAPHIAMGLDSESGE